MLAIHMAKIYFPDRVQTSPVCPEHMELMSKTIARLFKPIPVKHVLFFIPLETPAECQLCMNPANQINAI